VARRARADGAESKARDVTAGRTAGVAGRGGWASGEWCAGEQKVTPGIWAALHGPALLYPDAGPNSGAPAAMVSGCSGVLLLADAAGRRGRRAGQQKASGGEGWGGGGGSLDTSREGKQAAIEEKMGRRVENEYRGYATRAGRCASYSVH
jgi:hypothetical protein